MRTILLLGTALALGCPAARVASAGAQTPAQADAADRLARTVLPVDQLLALRVPRFVAAHAEEMKADARVVAVVKAHPEVATAIETAVREEAAKAYGVASNTMLREVAALYRTTFKPDELITLDRFFESATGQALVAMSIESTGSTPTAFEADRRAKAIAYLRDLDDAGKRDLTSLMESGLLPKVRAINPQISALSTERFSDAAAAVAATLPARIDALIARAEGKPAK